MVANRFNVPKKQWRKWSTVAREVFNETYSHMRNQRFYLHPQAQLTPARQWQTTRWNAAWIAADAAHASVVEIIAKLPRTTVTK